jgi:hypothetical protein
MYDTADTVFTVSTKVRNFDIFAPMQFGRRVEDRIRDLLQQALATCHPAPSVLSELQTAIHEYRARKTSGRHLCGQRRDDLTAVRTALGFNAGVHQTH